MSSEDVDSVTDPEPQENGDKPESEEPTEEEQAETTGAEDEGTDDSEKADEEEADEKPRKLTLDDIKTAPMDFRFPTTNQARHCFTRYIEYHKCIQAKGEDAPECDKFARYYRSLCPSEWVERWNEQRENGTFPGPL